MNTLWTLVFARFWRRKKSQYNFPWNQLILEQLSIKCPQHQSVRLVLWALQLFQLFRPSRRRLEIASWLSVCEASIYSFFIPTPLSQLIMRRIIYMYIYIHKYICIINIHKCDYPVFLFRWQTLVVAFHFVYYLIRRTLLVLQRAEITFFPFCFVILPLQLLFNSRKKVLLPNKEAEVMNSWTIWKSRKKQYNSVSRKYLHLNKM